MVEKSFNFTILKWVKSPLNFQIYLPHMAKIFLKLSTMDGERFHFVA